MRTEERDRTVLLVVDVQVGVMAESHDAPRVIATIADLVARARAASVPVVWVRHSSEDLLPGADAWQIVPELVPAASEPVVEKRYGDSFADTDLTDRLAERGAARVVLCGAQSDACIRSTFYGAVHRGYDVTLVSDAHTTEDMRPWGVTFGPEQAIEMMNLHARYTRLPRQRIGVAPAATALDPAEGAAR